MQPPYRVRGAASPEIDSAEVGLCSFVAPHPDVRGCAVREEAECCLELGALDPLIRSASHAFWHAISRLTPAARPGQFEKIRQLPAKVVRPVALFDCPKSCAVRAVLNGRSGDFGLLEACRE